MEMHIYLGILCAPPPRMISDQISHSDTGDVVVHATCCGALSRMRPRCKPRSYMQDPRIPLGLDHAICRKQEQLLSLFFCPWGVCVQWQCCYIPSFMGKLVFTICISALSSARQGIILTDDCSTLVATDAPNQVRPHQPTYDRISNKHCHRTTQHKHPLSI